MPAQDLDPHFGRQPSLFAGCEGGGSDAYLVSGLDAPLDVVGAWAGVQAGLRLPRLHARLIQSCTLSCDWDGEQSAGGQHPARAGQQRWRAFARGRAMRHAERSALRCSPRRLPRAPCDCAAAHHRRGSTAALPCAARASAASAGTRGGSAAARPSGAAAGMCGLWVVCPPGEAWMEPALNCMDTGMAPVCAEQGSKAKAPKLFHVWLSFRPTLDFAKKSEIKRIFLFL